MTGSRMLASLVVTVSLGAPGLAQTYSLKEAPVAHKYFQIQLEMALTGEIRVLHAGKPVPLKQAARAKHVFAQRVLAVGAGGLADKCAQLYKTATASITVGKETSDRTLRPERTLMVAQRHNDQGLIYCPGGPLTREELELTEHFDTLYLPGLLPGKAVPVGAHWKVGNRVVQALCNFEGLTSQNLECKLEQVHAGLALVSLQGRVTGIDAGALVKLAVNARYGFELESRRLTWLEWKQKEEREQGPISPSSTAEVTVTVKRAQIDACKDLSDVALVVVPPGYDPPGQMTQIYYCDKDKRFDFVHSREWHTVSSTETHLVMRLMERGDFIAQVTITPWTREQPGKHLTPEAFQEAMADTAGWDQEQVLQAEEVPADDGRWIYRLSALGKLDDLKVVQNFYVVASPAGEQVVLMFTMTQAQAQKIGTNDLTMVGNLDFPASRKEGAREKKPVLPADKEP
jgi:hypothetical protein